MASMSSAVAQRAGEQVGTGGAFAVSHRLCVTSLGVDMGGLHRLASASYPRSSVPTAL
jgi:hypothetical protein